MYLTTTMTVLATAGEFDRWRAERPFWGGVLLILASLVIGYVTSSFAIELLFIGGAYTSIGLVMAVAVFLSGVFALLRPDLSREAGITGIAFSLLSLIGALGGMFVGLLLGVVGGNLCLAWERPPDLPPQGSEPGRTERAGPSPAGSGGGFGGQQGTTAPTAGTDDVGSSDDGMRFAWQDNVSTGSSAGGGPDTGSSTDYGTTGTGSSTDYGTTGTGSSTDYGTTGTDTSDATGQSGWEQGASRSSGESGATDATSQSGWEQQASGSSEEAGSTESPGQDVWGQVGQPGQAGQNEQAGQTVQDENENQVEDEDEDEDEGRLEFAWEKERSDT